MTVRAGGTVLWRQGAGGVEVCLVHRPKYDDWSLPKGKAEPGEHLAETAVRETAEETGYDGALARFLGEVRYDVHSAHGLVDKVVAYWAMEALGGAFTPSQEVDRLQWLPPAQARRAVTRPDDRGPLDAFAAAPARTATVLLVRHAHAGARKAWKGPDALRPLDSVGLEEAAAIGRVLPAYGPAVVGSAAPLRCVQTVTPLATALGVAVEEMPALSEDTYHRRDAVDLLHDLAAGGRPAAVCSQGGVIPDVVEALADRRTLRPKEIAARKGSVWVLSFAAGRLVAADYLDSLTT